MGSETEQNLSIEHPAGCPSAASALLHGAFGGDHPAPAPASAWTDRQRTAAPSAPRLQQHRPGGDAPSHARVVFYPGAAREARTPAAVAVRP
jgi:hypothetical protein